MSKDKDQSAKRQRLREAREQSLVAYNNAYKAHAHAFAALIGLEATCAEARIAYMDADAAWRRDAVVEIQG